MRIIGQLNGSELTPLARASAILTDREPRFREVATHHTPLYMRFRTPRIAFASF